MIYWDNSSTTKPLPEVAASVYDALTENFGNPSSLHHLGLTAEKAMENARSAVAATLGLSARDHFREGSIFFTSGGTEADNTALFGMAEKGKHYGKRIVTTSVEHPAVLEACGRLEQLGYEVVYLPVEKDGALRPGAFEQALTPDTIAVSIMAVNNELGTVYPVADYAKLAHKMCPHALFHTDAVQAYGKMSFAESGQNLGLPLTEIDLCTVSAHKVHGPKGIGALYIRKGVHIPPFVYGGGQEESFRSGTENMPGIIGFGKAAEGLLAHEREGIETMKIVRETLKNGILDRIPDMNVNSPENGIPAILNVSFSGVRGEVLLHTLEQKEIYVSTGSACSSNSKAKGSHVLGAAGLSAKQIEGAIRFSFSGQNSPEEVEKALPELEAAVNAIRRNVRYVCKGETRSR